MQDYFKYGGLLLISVLFLLFGVNVLFSAYQVKDPFSFVMTFFASNLIILISAALAVGFALRLWRHHRSRRNGASSSGEDLDADDE